MFRFAGDFALLVVLIILFKDVIPLPISKAIVSLYVLFAIIHQTYYHSIKNIYNTEPLLINDFILMKRGLGIAYHGFKSWLLTGTVLLLIGVVLCLKFCSTFVSQIYTQTGLNYMFLAFLVLVVICSLYTINRYTNFKSVYGFLCFIMPTVKFYANIKSSIQQKQKLLQLKQLPFKNLDESNKLRLTTKKNIYFIGVESYGSLIYDDTKFPDFNKLISGLDKALAKNNWQVKSTYSESPISGGMSWLSYSTLLKGIHIDNESIYSYLFSDETHLTYQPFMQRLQNNGYTTYWLSSIGGYKKMKIPWERTLKFLGLNHVIKNDELAYTGKHFGFGPSPPDQYSLHKAHAIIKEKTNNNPFAMFWLTLNSHYPWDSPEHIVDDWQLLNQKQDKYWIDSNLYTQKKYEKAIIYQLQFLTDFILKKGTAQDVFVLIGDHQPFHVGEINNTNTPLHIISKDKQFIKAFENYDFSKGLLLKNNNKNTQNNLKHAGIQSLLIKVLNQTYSNSLESIYYKNGINEF